MNNMNGLESLSLSRTDTLFFNRYPGDTDEMENVPDVVEDGFEEAISKENLFRRRATVFPAVEQSGKIRTVTSTAIAEIAEENTPFPESADVFGTINFKSYKLASLSKLDRSFIHDAHFDVLEYLKNDFAKRFGRAEEKLFIQGTGDGEPKGILHSAEIGTETVDPELVYDDLYCLYFNVDAEFRKNGCWIMSDETAIALKGLKSNTGTSLWDENDTIFGKPVEISEYMNDATLPIAFGDLSFYWILQRSPLTVKVLREMFAKTNKFGFAAFERIDGHLIRPDAVKLLKVDAD